MAVRTFIYPTVPTTAPVGGATEAKQDVQISLATTLNTTVAKEAKQDTQITAANLSNTKLDTVITNTTGLATQSTLSALNTKVPAQGQAAMAASLPVVIASNQSTLSVSAASLPLPTGAATESTLTAINTKLPAQGQATMAASQPVVIASNQSAVPVTGPLTDVQLRATAVPVSGPLTDVQLRASAVPVSLASSPLPTGAATETTLARLPITQSTALGSNSGVMVQASVTTAAPTYTTGNINPLSLTTAGSLRVTDANLALAQGSTTAGQLGNLQLGAVTTANPTYTTAQSSPLSLTTAGALRTDNTTVAGTVIATGNGVVGAGVQRVAIASDNSVFTVRTGGRVSANAPSRNDYTSTPVTTGAFVQLVASTTSAINKLSIFDSSGQTLQFATGAAASEVVQFNIFPGGNGDVEISIPAGTRIAVRALSATANVGELNINYFT